MGLSITAASVNSAMLRVYNYVFGALLLTGAVAFGAAHTPGLLAVLMTKGALLGLILLTFVLLFGMSLVRKSESATGAKVMFVLFAVVWGLLFSGVFAVYTAGSIFLAFFSAALLFLTMSFYGYFTKRDINTFGDFFMVGLIGLILAGFINMIVGSNTASLVISALTVLLFLGITAWDAQTIRDALRTADTQADIEYATVHGAVSLYLDFLNLFINLLRLFGVPGANALSSDD